MNNRDLSENIAGLLVDPSFLYLVSFQKRRHFFNIISLNELNHSSMLSWLLDPNEEHGQGPFFLKSFLFHLASIASDKILIKDILKVNFDKVLIETEVSISKNKKDSRVDIVLQDPSSKKTFIIENKYGAGLTSDQLERYLDWGCDVSDKKSAKTYYILMDAYDNAFDTPDEWIVTNYEWVVGCIKSLLGRGILSRDNERLLRDYCIEIEGDYSLDPQFKDYEKHLARLAESHDDLLEDLRGAYDKFCEMKKCEYFMRDTKEYNVFIDELYNYRTVFEHLYEHTKFSSFKFDLTDNYDDYLFDICLNRFSVIPSIMEKYFAEEYKYWPISLSLKSVFDTKTEKTFYKIYLWLNKDGIVAEKEDILNYIAEKHNKKFRGEERTRTINLESFGLYERDKILSKLRYQLDELIKDVMIS